MRRQLAFVFDDIDGCRVDRLLAGLVDGNAEGFSRERVHVSASADSVLAHKGPGEVGLDAAGGFSDQRDSAGGRTSRRFVIAWSELNAARDVERFVDESVVGRAVGFEFGKDSLFSAKFEAFDPRFA